MPHSSESDAPNASPKGSGSWQEESFGFVLYDAVTDTLYEGREEGTDVLAIHADEASRVHVTPSPADGLDDVGGLVESLLSR